MTQPLDDNLYNNSQFDLGGLIPDLNDLAPGALADSGMAGYGPSKVATLRKAGKLEEAYHQGLEQLKVKPTDIWAKRDMSWVLYSLLKVNIAAEKFNIFLNYLKEISQLALPANEKMLYDQLGWQIGKMVFELLRTQENDFSKYTSLYHYCKTFPFSKPSEVYSFLFKGFHKAFKDTAFYCDFADFWDFDYFRPEDYQKDKMPNGKEIMAVAEQAYINYAKHLLPKKTFHGEVNFNKDKVLVFLPRLEKIIESHPEYQYPGYFKAKLLLALGETDNMLSALLPFARKKKNEFWVWDILADAFKDDNQKAFECYCKGLSCRSKEEMLVGIRQKIAAMFISRKEFDAAKTEIEISVTTRQSHGFKIPADIANWQKAEWYQQAQIKKSNADIYKKHLAAAEAILFNDVLEESVIIEFVNPEKKMLSFIVSESKFGFFKYGRYLQDVKVGETLKVRFQAGSKEGLYQVYTVVKAEDEVLNRKFIKEIEGEVRIANGKEFGFINDVFIHPTIVKRRRLVNGMKVKGTAIKTYIKDKKEWGWKLII